MFNAVVFFVHSCHVFRNEFYKLFAEGERAKCNTPFPTMTAHRADDKPRNRNATRPNAMPNDPPLSTGIYFWPKEITASMTPEQAHATYCANWQGVFLQQHLNPCRVNYTGHCIPPFPPNIHWDFDDCDGDFDAYDYDDDAENFLRDEKAMEEALAGGTEMEDDDLEEGMLEAMGALYFDDRLRNIFRPNNPTHYY